MTGDQNEPEPEYWAVVELMGHARIAGRVSSDNTLGAAFLRVDVPAVEGLAGFTKLIGPPAVYAVTFVSEQIARGIAAKLRARPITSYELRDLGSDRELRLALDDERLPIEDDDEDDERRPF